MTTTANIHSMALLSKDGPSKIKRKPRLPRHQRLAASAHLDEMDMNSQLAEAAKKLHLTTMELIKQTLAASFQYGTPCNPQSASTVGADQSPQAWQAPQTETHRHQASVSLAH